VATGRESFTLQATFLNSPCGVQFSPDGQLLAVADSGPAEGLVKIYEVMTGHLERTLHAHNLRVASIAFSSDSKRLASGGMDKTAKLWDLGTRISSITCFSTQTAGAWPRSARMAR
jgi:WD40 repeat protein